MKSAGRIADARALIHSPIEAILAHARAGRAYVMVDDVSAAGVGCWVIPAVFATPDRLNDMARHATGLICLALDAHRADQLHLPLIGKDRSRRGAYTVSIEAREGVTTGISTRDRAQTISVAIDPDKGTEDIVSPGHVFPLVASPGGVLATPGQAEAAVDVARLAGLNPSGVICEIMTEDGAIAHGEDLAAIADQHGLVVGRISDLIAHRRRRERLVERIETPALARDVSPFRLAGYRSLQDGAEHLALVRGDIRPDIATSVHIHRSNSLSYVLGLLEGRAPDLATAFSRLEREEGPAVIIVVRDAGPLHAGAALADVHFDACAQILKDLGVRRMALLRSEPEIAGVMAAHGLDVLAPPKPSGQAA